MRSGTGLAAFAAALAWGAAVRSGAVPPAEPAEVWVVTVMPGYTTLPGPDGGPGSAVPRGTPLRVESLDGGMLRVLDFAGMDVRVARDEVVPLADAVGYFTEAIRRRPSAADYFERGRLRLEVGQGGDPALADFDAAIRLDPAYADAYEARGDLRLSRGEADAALADLTEAIRLAPDRSWLYSHRAEAWERKGEFARAVADYDAYFARVRRDEPYLLVRRGAARWKADDRAGAVADLDEAARLGMPDAGSAAVLAGAYADLGEFVKAAEQTRRAIGLDPSDDDRGRRAMLAAFEQGEPWREGPREERPAERRGPVEAPRP